MEDSQKHSFVTKSDRIRDYLRKNPLSRPKDIAEGLKEHEISYQLISKIAGEVRAAATPEKKAIQMTNLPNNSINVSLIDRGIGFVDACGGIDKAQEVLYLIKTIWNAKHIGEDKQEQEDSTD
jgi:hypothetical protein